MSSKLHSYIFVIFTLPNIATTTYADELDSRESCRKRVAGLYLNYFDEAKKSSKALKKNSINLSKTQIALNQARKDLSSMQQLNDNLPYDAERFHKQQSLEQRVKILENNVSQYKKLIKPLKSSEIENTKQASKLKKKIAKVFKFEKKDPLTFGYPFFINWKSTCPQWRSSCPLTREDAKNLIKIWDTEAPLICQRYSQILY